MANSYEPGLVYSSAQALQRSRAIIARTDLSSKEAILEACKIMRFHGDFIDCQRAQEVERAIKRGEQNAMWGDDDMRSVSASVHMLGWSVIAVLIGLGFALYRLL